MAALSSKLGAGLPTVGLLASKGRILAVGVVNTKVSRLHKKDSGGREGVQYIKIR
jgi:hypothetical protein